MSLCYHHNIVDMTYLE